MQTFLKITFSCTHQAAVACSCASLHITKEETLILLLAPCSATTTSSLPLEFQKSILAFQALTAMNKGELRKQQRLMSPENGEHIYLLISLVWQEHPLACSSWY